jgi:hypothetical protein
MYASVKRRPCAEQRSAHPHHGRTFFDRHFEVVAHPHRQFAETVAKALPAAFQQVAQRGKTGARPIVVGSEQSDRHQAAELYPGQWLRQQLLHGRVKFLRAQTVLGRVLRHVDLQQQLERCLSAGPRLGQAPGESDAVNRVDPLEPPRHVAGLVGLQMPDEMPGQRGVPEVLDLLQRFLYLAFAEIADTQINQRLYGCLWLGLGHGDQSDLVGRTPGAPRGRGDARVDGFQAFTGAAQGAAPISRTALSRLVA